MRNAMRNVKRVLVVAAAAGVAVPSLALVGCASDEPGHSKTTTKTTVTTPTQKTTTTETHEKDTTVYHNNN